MESLDSRCGSCTPRTQVITIIVLSTAHSWVRGIGVSKEEAGGEVEEGGEEERGDHGASARTELSIVWDGHLNSHMGAVHLSEKLASPPEPVLT